MDGKFMLASSKYVCPTASTEDAEVRALNWAMLQASNHNWDCVIFKGDCKNIIDAVNGYSRRSFHVHTRVDNCIHHSSRFQSCYFVFCNRECNLVAHRLTRWAVSSRIDEVWVASAPTWLEDVMYFDSINSNA
ncbi:unnamed protein product [Amaranthus hypochondriacus]